MGSSSHELNLDFKQTYTSKTIAQFLNEISTIENVSEKQSKLEDYIERLEEETKKIDAFKRQLPLCMYLLTDAIGLLKMETMRCSSVSNARPVMEEFIPLTRNFDKDIGVELEIDNRDKKNWMSSAQLWTSNVDERQRSVERAEEKVDPTATKSRFHPCRGTNLERPFQSFKGFSSFSASRKEDKDLSFRTQGITIPSTEPSSALYNSKSSGGIKAIPPSSTTNTQSDSQIPTQSPQISKKQRRCWSPDLHRRFVDALRHLGGSQVATPKQIRELMRVDGLTNDEVKSHLQKFRLHNRKLSAQSAHGVVLGEVWMHQDQCGGSKSTTSESESPQGPLQLTGIGGGISTTCGDSMEEEDDGKSEGYSWRSHFGKSGNDEA